jgi:hypothetical protein
MQIEPATVDQVRIGMEGRVVVIDAESSMIVAELQKIDPCIRVRFAEDADPPFWAVSTVSEDGLTHHLVLTAKATITNSGTWTGLDERIVKRVEEIDQHGRGHYDYAKEVERQNTAARRQREYEFRERMGEIGQEAQRDLAARIHARDHRRIFVSKDLS